MDTRLRWAKRLLVCAAVTLLHGALIGLAIFTAPAGEVIAYSAPGRSTQDIFIEDVRTGLARNLTASFKSHHETSPAWSPDGQQLVFSASSDSYSPSDLYVIGMDGSGLRRLTTFAGNDFHPAWSPDSRHIVYASYIGGTADIFIVDADGSNRQQLNESPAYDDTPAWSPDGRFIAFHSVQEGRRWISVIAADGSSERLLIEGDYSYPAWSSDGTQLALLSGGEIIMMKVEDGSLQQLDIEGNKMAFAWLPGGQQIAYITDCYDCSPVLYVMEIASGTQRRVGYVNGNHPVPAWRP